MKTRFPVVNLSIEDFRNLALTTINENYGTEFAIQSQDVPFLNEQEADACRIREVQVEQRYGLMVSGRTDTRRWQETYLFEAQADMSGVFSMQREDWSIGHAFGKQEPFRVPAVIQHLLWEEHGGQDDLLHTSAHALVAGLHDVSTVTRLITQPGVCELPVIYVSAMNANGRYALNYEKLAAAVMGFAHVVVEGSPVVARRIREATNSQNAYDGAIRLIYPTGESSTYLATTHSAKSLFNLVVRMVATFWSNTYLDGISLTNLVQSYLHAQLANHGSNDELLDLCDEMLRQKDADIATLNQTVDDLKQKVYVLNSQLNWNGKGSDAKSGITLSVDETEFYPGEHQDVVLRILQHEYNRLRDDSTLGRSRKVHVLASLLHNNQMTGRAEELREIFIKATKDGTIDKSMMGILRAAGFEICPNTKRHYKVCYQGDERYQTAIALTPSDYRGAANLQSSFLNQLFGY